MKPIILAALLLGGSALAANAESFTFTGSGTTINAMSVTAPDGSAVVAAFNSGKAQLTYASGKTVTSTSTCEQHSTPPPVGVFQQMGECNLTDPTGNSSILFGCNPSKDKAAANCVGGLWGTAGAYAGKSGTLSWHATSSADGKSATFTGTGQWN
jgi:hypothetical protein